MGNWKLPITAAILFIGAAGGFYAWYTYAPLQVRLCEEFIKDGLASQSSYHRVSVFEDNEAATVDEMKKLDLNYLDWPSLGKPSLLLVAIEFDADNAYGANLRGGQVCAFELRDGKGNDVTWKTGASMSQTSAMMRRLLESGAVKGPKGGLGPTPKYDCCL